jgi:hypothetical protein
MFCMMAKSPRALILSGFDVYGGGRAYPAGSTVAGMSHVSKVEQKV